MYAYLDRPVADLAAAERLLLDGVRCWALSRTLGGDPAAALGRRMPILDEAGALRPLDRLMAAIDRDGSDAIEIQRPCFDSVEEVEAVLLAVADLARDHRLDEAAAALALLVRPATADTVAPLLAEFHRRAAPALARTAAR